MERLAIAEPCNLVQLFGVQVSVASSNQNDLRQIFQDSKLISRERQSADPQLLPDRIIRSR